MMRYAEKTIEQNTILTDGVEGQPSRLVPRVVPFRLQSLQQLMNF
jgi:hypothetical protein